VAYISVRGISVVLEIASLFSHFLSKPFLTLSKNDFAALFMTSLMQQMSKPRLVPT